MKHLMLVLLCCLSLPSCAQSNQSAQAAVVTQAEAETTAAIKEPTYAPGSPEARVRAALANLSSKLTVERIDAAPLPGFREVVANGQVLYVSDDGKYVMQGALIDVAKRKDLSEAAMAKVRKQVLASIPEKDRIVFAPAAAPKHTVVVLTDVECGFCRKFHSQIADYTQRGIRVEYLAFPRNGLGSDDYRKMVAVWCAPDRRKALTDAKNDRPIARTACARTPVDMEYRAGQRMGLEGTPMILTADGRLVGGYLSPDALATRLDMMDAS